MKYEIMFALIAVIGLIYLTFKACRYAVFWNSVGVTTMIVGIILSCTGVGMIVGVPLIFLGNIIRVVSSSHITYPVGA